MVGSNIGENRNQHRLVMTLLSIDNDDCAGFGIQTMVWDKDSGEPNVYTHVDAPQYKYRTSICLSPCSILRNDKNIVGIYANAKAPTIVQIRVTLSYPDAKPSFRLTINEQKSVVFTVSAAGASYIVISILHVLERSRVATHLQVPFEGV